MKTSSLPRISDAEWEIMNVLWEKGASPLGVILEDLDERKKWKSRTVRTLLARLVKKKCVRIDPDPVRYIYHPVLKRSDCVREEGRTFLDRVFGGEPAEMLVHFLKESRLKPDEIDELKKILKDKEAK